MNEKYGKINYCIAAPPFLWQVTASVQRWFALLTLGLSVALIILIAIRKIKKRQVFDNKFWKFASFILPLFIFSFFPLVENFFWPYVWGIGIFLIMQIVGQRLRLFKMKRFAKAAALVLLILFSAALIFKSVESSSKESAETLDVADISKATWSKLKGCGQSSWW